MTATPERGVSPWSLSFLRAGLLASMPAAGLAAVVVGLLMGWAAAVTVLLGAVVVALFFCLSGAVIAWAGRLGDAFTLPAALGTFVLKVAVIGAVFQSLPVDGWLDRRVLGWTVIAGALFWSVVQSRWVWTRQLYYVTPPEPRSTRPAEDGPAVRSPRAGDPENRTTRG